MVSGFDTGTHKWLLSGSFNVILVYATSLTFVLLFKIISLTIDLVYKISSYQVNMEPILLVCLHVWRD